MGGAGQVTVLVGGGERGGAAGPPVQALGRLGRMEGGGVGDGVSLAVTLFLFLLVLLVILVLLFCEALPLLRLEAAGVSAPRLPAGVLLIGEMRQRQRQRLLRVLRHLPALVLHPSQQALDLPVGRTQAAGLDQVLQGCVELPERGGDEIWQGQNKRRNGLMSLSQPLS